MRTSPGRPLIGITGPRRGNPAGRWAAGLAVYRAGGRPTWLLPGRGEPDTRLRGVVITGGSDINPKLYGVNDPPFSPPDVLRDDYELAVLGFASRKKIPLLGICRGAQLLNVFRGGALHTDISHQRKLTSNKSSIRPSKWISVAAGSMLENVLGTAQLRVNSLHHQAVSRTGEGLRAVAWDRDGIVQAIEARQEAFLVGVQWHPEYLQLNRTNHRLFRSLVAAASMTGDDRIGS